MDQEAQARLRQQAPQTYARLDQGQPLSLADVKALAAAKAINDVIVSQIRNSRTVFHLSSADIIDLKNSGVDETIIEFMINTTTSMPALRSPARRWSQRRLMHPPRPWLSRPVRVMCGWAANGSGMAARFGWLDTGPCRRIRTQFGSRVMGERSARLP